MAEVSTTWAASAPQPAQPQADAAMLRAVGWRALTLQATFTYERFQGAGFAFALLPVLRRLWPDPAALAAATVRHMDYFNTNPVLCPYVLGAAARLEADVAAGGSVEVAKSYKTTVGGPVAALGDRLMWGTVRPLATTAGVLVALRWPVAGMLVMLAGYNLPQIALRLRGLDRGAALGAAALRDVTGPRFARVTERAAQAWTLLAGILAGVFLLHVPPEQRGPQGAVWLIFAVVSGLLFARRRLSPTLLALLGMGVGLVATLLAGSGNPGPFAP